MPNHVTNILVISGPTPKVLTIRSFMLNEEGELDFEVLAPMPEVLRTITTGSTTIAGEKVSRWIEDEAGKPRRLSAVEEIAANTCGGDWYKWAVSNWGTKWNAYDQDFKEVIFEDTTRLECKFQTAWAMPDKWFEKLCARVPAGVTVSLNWADEDFGQNTGWAVKDDDGLETTFVKEGSDEAMDHAADILGYDPREEEAEEAYERELNEELPEELEDGSGKAMTLDKPTGPVTGPVAEFECPADWETEVYN